MKTRYLSHALFVGVVFLTFLINYDWGVPNERRLELVGGQAVVSENISDLVRVAKISGPAAQDLSYEDSLHKAVTRFLLVPWSGDEIHVLKAIGHLNPYKLKFDPHFYIYGGGFIYTGAAFVQVASMLGVVHIVSDMGYYLKNPSEFGKIVAVLRSMVVVFATLGIYFVFLLAGKYFGQAIALLSCGIVLVIPDTQASVRGIEPHIFVLPLFITSFYFALKATEGNPTKNYILAAVFAGFSIGTQATSFYIIFSFIASLFINYKKGTVNLNTALIHFIKYTMISVCSMLLLNPFMLINYKGFLSDVGRGTGNVLFNTGHIWAWAPYQITWFILILFFAALLFHLFKYRRNDFSMIALACALPAILVYLATDQIMQYVYSSLTVMAVLAAVMLRDFYGSFAGVKKTAFVVVTSALFVLFPIGQSTYYLLNYTAENSESAGEWINQNVAQGLSVGVRYPPTLWDSVPFKIYDYKIVDYKTLRPEDVLPDFIVLSNAELPGPIKKHYELAKKYESTPILGYRYALEGEIHALIAKTILIYKKHS